MRKNAPRLPCSEDRFHTPKQVLKLSGPALDIDEKVMLAIDFREYLLVWQEDELAFLHDGTTELQVAIKLGSLIGSDIYTSRIR